MAGYLTIYRSIFDTAEWREKRQFSSFEAWLDLIAMASYVKRIVTLKDRGEVSIRRGEVLMSQRQLAQRWNWSPSKVNRCLKRWASSDDGRIEIHTRRVTVFLPSETPNETPHETPSETEVNVIRLCNYDRYNGVAVESETPNETPHETPHETSINKYIELRDNNTHTQFDYLKFFTHTHEAHAHTPEQMCAVASAIREQVQRGELPEYKSIDDIAKGMIWLYAEYPELMQRFKRPCTRQDFQTISQMCEVEDVKGIVEALANKLSGDKPLNSFLATFKQWAALDYRIKDKARLGNPRYSKLS